MPVGISSPARNLFLLGSSGDTLVTNFFKSIDKSAAGIFDEVFVPTKTRYRYSDDSYILAGYAQDGNSRRLGWIENRTYNPDNASSTEVWHTELESLDFASSSSTTSTSLFDLCIDGNGNLFAVGESNNTNWIAKYNSSGGLQWLSTSQRGQAAYRAVASDGKCSYATGESQFSPTDCISFVEKYDDDGSLYWGTVINFDDEAVFLKDVGVASDGNVIAVGDINFDYGYMVKLDSGTGQVLWDKTFKSPIYKSGSSEPQNVRPEKLFVDGKGQIYIIGRTLYYSDYNSFLIKCDPEGNIIWQRTVEGVANESIEFIDISAETETEQVIVYGTFEPVSGRQSAMLSKYTKDGSLLWRRTIETDANPSGSGLTGTGFALDADSSFYYMTFCDQLPNGLTGVPDRYTFGKVSTSGNGLGDFQYSDSMSHTIDYKIKNDLQHKIGVFQDNSVSTNVSNLISNPFSANTILFDDYATNISGKKRLLGHTHGEEVANKWFYSSGDALSPVPFAIKEFIPGVTPIEGEVSSTDLPSLNSAGIAYVFTNPSGNATLDDHIDIDFKEDVVSSSPFSVEFWFNCTKSTTSFIVTQVSPNNGDAGSAWRIERNNSSNGTIEFGVNTGGAGFSGSETISTNFPDNEWLHCICTFTSGTAKIYKNGVLDTTNNSATTNPTHPSDSAANGVLRIGARMDSSPYDFEGQIGEVRVYNKRLTDEEVYQNYNAKKGKYLSGTDQISSIAPKVTTDVPYSFTQVSGTALKLFVDFGNRYSYSTAENRHLTSSKNGSDWNTGTRATVEANAGIAPDGTKTATLVTEANNTGFHFISSSATLQGARTFSAYLKAGNQPRATMFITQTGNNGARFDLETGQIVSVYGTGNTAAIEDVGGGWYRCMVTNDNVAAEIDDQLRIGTMNGATNSEAPASPLRSIYLWGPQVEKTKTNPPTAGRYIKTYGSSKNLKGNLNNLLLTGEKPFLVGDIANAPRTHNGGYLSFDGVNDHITFNTPISLTAGLGWTVELWIRVMDPVNDNTAGTWNYFFRDEPSGAPTYECGMYSNGTAFAIKDNDAANTNLQMTMTPGVWHYIAFGVTATLNNIFMTSSDANGNITHQVSTGVVSGVPCVIKRLMSNQTGGQYLKADIGEIRIKDNQTGSGLAEDNFNATRNKYGI